MPNSAHPFLFLLTLTLFLPALTLDPIGYCLGHCATCNPLNFIQCQGTTPCQNGYLYQNGTCRLQPTYQISYQQLPTRTVKEPGKPISSWGEQTKLSICTFNASGITHYIDAIGFYQRVSMVQHTYKVYPDTPIFIFSFTLLRNEWLPLNDFIILDINAGFNNLYNYEISYEIKITIDSQPQLLCNNTLIITDRYSLTIINDNNIKDQITVVFTSFLYNSLWGLTDIQLLEGCQAYTIFDQSQQICGLCDSDAYPVAINSANWCQKCPNYCASCNKNGCLSCLSGTILRNNECIFAQKYKTQMMELSSKKSECAGVSFYKRSQILQINGFKITNQNSQLYDQVQLGFRIFYNPTDWKNNSTQIILTINQHLNFTITSSNLTNRGTTSCSILNGNRMASIYLLTPVFVHVDNILKVDFAIKSQSKNVQYGISDIAVKSPKKIIFNNNKLDNVLPTPIISKYTQESVIPSNPVPINNKIQPVVQKQAQIVIQKQVQIVPNSSISNIKQQPIQNIIKAKQNKDTLTDPIITNSNITIPVNNTNITTQFNNTKFRPSIQAASPSFSSLTYITSSQDEKSGIQVILYDIPYTNISAYINILNSSSVKIITVNRINNNLHVFIEITQAFVNGTLTITSNSPSRLLQASNVIAQATIERYDYLTPSQIESARTFSVFFAIFSWVGIILIITFALLGNSIVLEEYIISLQNIFLHVYIAANILPLSFRDVIGGLKRVENLNFFIPIHSTDIEHSWLGNVVQNGPIRFSLFHTDINFSRSFFPIIIINIIYCIWFILLYFSKRYLFRKDIIEEEKNFFHKIVDRIVNRPINFCDQIWRYQFLATVWCCFVQFYNLAYPQNSNRSQTANALVCIASFICTLAWPVFKIAYCRKQYYECEYAEYLYYFEDLYYHKIPQYYLPSNHHRIGYPIFRAGKLFFTALFIAFLGEYPVLPLLFLMLVNSGEIVYAKYQQIYTDNHYFKLKIMENSLFFLIDFLIFVLILVNINTTTFVTMGFILSALCLLIIVNSCVRAGYLMIKKYQQMIGQQDFGELNHKKPETERIV